MLAALLKRGKQHDIFVGGHQRLKVLIDRGIAEVDCVVVEMEEEKEKALNIALNKISGDWDTDKPALLISDLQNAECHTLNLKGSFLAIMGQICNAQK